MHMHHLAANSLQPVTSIYNRLHHFCCNRYLILTLLVTFTNKVFNKYTSVFISYPFDTDVITTNRLTNLIILMKLTQYRVKKRQNRKISLTSGMFSKSLLKKAARHQWKLTMIGNTFQFKLFPHVISFTIFFVPTRLFIYKNVTRIIYNSKSYTIDANKYR